MKNFEKDNIDRQIKYRQSDKRPKILFKLINVKKATIYYNGGKKNQKTI